MATEVKSVCYYQSIFHLKKSLAQILFYFLLIEILSGCYFKASIDGDGLSSESIQQNLIVKGVPSGVDKRTSFELEVATAVYTSYAYKVGIQNGIDCSDILGYTIIPDLSSVNVNYNTLADGPVTLCTVGVSKATLDLNHTVKSDWIKDTIRPTVTVNQSSTQIDPSPVLPIKFDILFSEAIDPNSFTVSDITQNGSASGITWLLTTSDNRSWSLTAVASTSYGTINPQIAANIVSDLAGNNNQASTTTDSLVTYYDPTPARPSGLTLGYGLLPIDIEPSPTIDVSGVTSGNTVKLFTDASCTTEVSSGVASSTSISLITFMPLIDGNYTFYANQSNGSYTSPCSTASVNYLLDTIPSEISAVLSVQKTTEGAADSTLVFQMSPTKPYNVTVNYNLIGTTAVLGTQYSLSPGSLTFLANQATASLTVPTPDTAATDGARIVQINLESKPYRTIYFGKQYQMKLYIEDTETPTGQAISSSGTGNGHSCAVNASGVLRCWGKNTNGQVGNNTTTNQIGPVVINSGTSYQKVSAGEINTCGITVAGALRCWGNNTYNQVGDGTSTQRLIPVTINSGTSYSHVSVGKFHACAITVAGVLKCWGYGIWGQIGDGTALGSSTPKVIDTGTNYLWVDAGDGHTCGVTSTGVLKCWGDNNNGQIGDGTNTSAFSPVVVDAGVSYVKSSAGGGHSCGITTTGVLKCWGFAYAGQIGNNSTTNVLSPVIIDAGVNYQYAVAGYTSTCGITTTGVLKCWGQMGYTWNSLSPIVLDSGVSYKSVDFYWLSGCARTTDNSLKCWGDHNYGSLGDGETDVFQPISFDSSDSYQLVSGFGSAENRTCAISLTGKLKCWGIYSLDGTTLMIRSTPVGVDTGETYQSIAVETAALSSGHNCGITTAKKLKCWGTNTNGGIGDNSTVFRSYPTVVDPGVLYNKVSVGLNHSCGITTAGVLKCWGSNSSSELGDGTTTDRLIPTIIDAGTTYKEVAMGDLHTCGITTTDVLKCWGVNFYGQLGDGTTTASSLPLVIDSGVSYNFVAASSSHTCGITSTGVLKCWGRNNNGQLGDGTTVQKTTPVVIDTGITYQAVSLAKNHTCGFITGGVLKCWGQNLYGQLGDGTVTNRLLPVTADSGASYKSITAGLTYSCGISSIGELRCWGTNLSHPLGIGRNYSVFFTIPFGL